MNATKIVVANLYIFGSCMQVNTPNDIDLLWVYDGRISSTRQALDFVNHKTKAFQSMTSIPFHNTVLSNEEERSSRFIRASCAVFLNAWTINEQFDPHDIITQIDALRKGNGLTAISNKGNEEPL